MDTPTDHRDRPVDSRRTAGLRVGQSSGVHKRRPVQWIPRRLAGPRSSVVGRAPRRSAELRSVYNRACVIAVQCVSHWACTIAVLFLWIPRRSAGLRVVNRRRAQGVSLEESDRKITLGLFNSYLFSL
jgi:hypothetical protein